MNLVEKIKEYLTPDLLKKNYINRSHPLAGHCYVASEAFYHLIEDPWNYKPMVGRLNVKGKVRCSHWWIEHRGTAEIIDITAVQFTEEQLQEIYKTGKGCGFLTSSPSKRAQIVIDRVEDSVKKNLENS